MSLSNYTELKAAVEHWLARSGMTSDVPDFITLAEEVLNERLRLSNMETEAGIAVTLGSDVAVLPSGFLEAVSFIDDNFQELTPLPSAGLCKFKSGNAAKPSVYAVTTQIEFPDNSDASYTYSMRYFKRLNLAADATNWVLTTAPSVYLYTALAQAFLFTRSQLLEPFIQMSEGAISRLKTSDRKTRKGLLRTELTGGGGSSILLG